MAANDRIKDIATVRKWLREFSLFGDKTRSDFTESGYRYAYEKSDQLLDPILNTVRDNHNCQHVFISLDVRDVYHNPLFVFYRIHYFRDNDIKLHFTILNCLADGRFKTIEKIIYEIYETCVYGDEDIHSSLYRKLNEYLKLGIIVSKKDGKKILYALNHSSVDLKRWSHAIHFFSEIDPLGVIGSYLRDRLDRTGLLPGCEPFLFRHHYIHHVLDAEIIPVIAEAIHKKLSIIVSNNARHQTDISQKREIIPVRFYHSVQSGRRYLAACRKPSNQLTFLRLDRIQSVELGNPIPDYQKQYQNVIERLEHVWGVSDIGERELTHLEMVVRVYSPGDYALKRLELEKRHGVVEHIDSTTSRFSIDVWEVREMLPWVRTFIGHIVSLKCSNQNFIDQFKHDLRKSLSLYSQV